MRIICVLALTCIRLPLAAAGLSEALEFVSDFLFHKHSVPSLDDSYKATGKMELIGAGFARTGTKSTEEALKKLGYKIYDTRSMMEHSDHAQRWVAAAQAYGKDHNDLSEMEALLAEIEQEGYTATLDSPMNLFAPHFAKLRPEAKVLMTVRDTEQKWLESWREINHLLSFFVCRPWVWLIGNMDFVADIILPLENFDFVIAKYPKEIDRILPWYEKMRVAPTLDPPEGQQMWIDLHKRFQKRLSETLPPERFLVFNVKQGWGPLLSFLKVDNEALAKEDFPNVNDRESLQKVRMVVDIIGIGLPLWLMLYTYIIYAVASWIFRKCKGGKLKSA